MTNFWESSVWVIMIQFFVVAAFVLLGNTLRRKIPFVRKSLLPTSVIAGLLILILKSVWGWFDSIIDTDFMSVVTYHTLALGFIAIALKMDEKKEKGKSVFFETGIVTVNSYIIQGIIGLVITVVLSLFISELLPVAGLILPMGFGQGPGQALSWGTVYETQYGFIGGATFGLSIAALGFLAACIVGVIYLNILKRKNKLPHASNTSASHNSDVEFVATKNEVPLTDSIDRFSLQVVLVLFTYFITYLLMAGITFLCDNNYLGNFGINTLKPLIWGFNFLFGTLFGIAVKMLFKFFRKKKIMHYVYPSNYLLNRLSGFFFDIMIVAGIAAIEITDLEKLWIPLLLLGVGGAIVTIIYLNIVKKYLWKGYEWEGFFSMFGMLTGTASTGIILLREIDPEFKTPAADNLVYQNFSAIIFGFPVLLLLGYAPQNPIAKWVTLGILVVMFIVYNILIYRKKIIKKKIKEQVQ